MRGNPATSLPLAFTLLLATAACDNTVDPFVADSRGDDFAVYGYLDAGADTQFVRIAPVIDAADLTFEDSLGAVAELHDIPAAASTRMQDSSVAIEGGRRAYIYSTTMPRYAGSVYRLDVFYPGRDTLRISTRVPGPDQVEIDEPRADIRGFLVQPVQWTDVFRVRDVLVTYDVQTAQGPRKLELPYLAPTDAEAPEILVRLERDRDVVMHSLAAEVDTSRVSLLTINVSAELLSQDWAHAATSSRLFFGAVGRVSRSWTVSDSVAHRIGYYVP